MNFFEFVSNYALAKAQAEAQMIADEAAAFLRCGYRPDELVCGCESRPRGGRFARTSERFIMPRSTVPESVADSEDGFDWGEEEDEWD